MKQKCCGKPQKEKKEKKEKKAKRAGFQKRRKENKVLFCATAVWECLLLGGTPFLRSSRVPSKPDRPISRSKSRNWKVLVFELDWAYLGSRLYPLQGTFFPAHANCSPLRPTKSASTIAASQSTPPVPIRSLQNHILPLESGPSCGLFLQGQTAGVGPYFHLPGFHFRTLFLSHSHLSMDTLPPNMAFVGGALHSRFLCQAPP